MWSERTVSVYEGGGGDFDHMAIDVGGQYMLHSVQTTTVCSWINIFPWPPGVLAHNHLHLDKIFSAMFHFKAV